MTEMIAIRGVTMGDPGRLQGGCRRIVTGALRMYGLRSTFQPSRSCKMAQGGTAGIGACYEGSRLGHPAMTTNSGRPEGE
jgi:hypothetical protein